MKAKGLTLKPGHTIAERYVIKSLIGTGGAGTIYLASDKMLNDEEIALKILHSHYAKDERERKRFLREVQLTRKITHENVVRTFDVGQEEEGLFFTMEYIKGITLRKKYIGKPLEYNKTIKVLVETCKGLDAIHRAGVTHRDLKPGNIIITTQKSLKICDFGIARPDFSTLTPHDEVLGSARYISPEMCKGQEVSFPADIYALGIIAYELIAGMLPFTGPSLVDMVQQHLMCPPPAVKQIEKDTPDWLNKLVLQMMQKEPARRPESGGEILKIIRENHQRQSK